MHVGKEVIAEAKKVDTELMNTVLIPNTNRNV